MATYAEYLFKHKEKTYTEIKNIVLKEIATFGKYKINYEINFEEQSEIPLDLLYLKSSMLFFDKEEDLSKKIIKHIIKIGNKKNKKIKAKKLLKIYNLL